MDIGGDEQALFYPEDNGQPADPVNISDVLEAIGRAESSRGAVVESSMAHAPAQPHASVEIVEQPAPRALRFRYPCEGRSAGSLPGVNSTPENKTYPTVRINNYLGPVTIVVSLVTKEAPFKPHPHKLVGRDRCDRGVSTIKALVTEENNEYQFKNLGIQCVRRKDIHAALEEREKLRVDPFRTGYEHSRHPQSIDLNAVRLAFQVFVPEGGASQRLLQLKPVVSDVIYDKKASGDVLITRASHCSDYATGGKQVILLCEKISKDDTAVVFYQEDGVQVLWEQVANTVMVHKQHAIVFDVPPYRDPATTQHVEVFFQLKRLSDNARSNSLPFEYIPAPENKKRKTPHSSLREAVFETDRLGHGNPFAMEHSVKQEPNRTSPMYSPPGPSFAEYQQQQWQSLEPHPQQWGGYSPGGYSPREPPGPYSPQAPGGRIMSPHDSMHGSPNPMPMGGLSPMCSPQPPARSPLGPTMGASLGPTMSPLGPAVSPMGPAMGGGLLQPPMPQHMPLDAMQLQMQQQLTTSYQVDQAMESGPSLSQLLADADAEFPSLSALAEDRENLSDSLRNLSTNDLFKMTRH